MSRIAELLRQKRVAQIARMSGRFIDTTAVDAELDAIRRRLRSMPLVRFFNTRELRITKHARKRINQRKIPLAAIDAIWRYGETTAYRDGRRIHRVTRRAIEDVDGEDRARLEAWRGTAIVVAPPRGLFERRPSLVTVLALGEDTYVGRGRRES